MDKKIPAVLIIALITIFIGCMSVSYSQLGNKYESLPEDTPVKVFIAETPKFEIEQIGIVQIEKGSLDRQIEKAKEIARDKGGDVIILIERTRGAEANVQPYTGGYATSGGGFNLYGGGGHYKEYDIRTFKIARRVRE